MRILAADDDPQVRDVLSRLLAKLGAEVRVARDGEEALAMLKDAMRDADRRFDAAFVDLHMPWSSESGSGGERGGLDLASAFRAEEERSGSSRVRLVALTGADDARDGDARRAGFDHFLQKPVGLDALRRELGRLT